MPVQLPRRRSAASIRWSRRKDAILLDTPVSGSVSTVESGTLTIMVGGDQDALDRARPVLETFAKSIFHLGEVGAGATMKLVVNALIGALNVAVSEALGAC
jgi:3-hydroxyisobutyrate dehydrogenase-like beta-hydroxyacid dehydrogenase